MNWRELDRQYAINSVYEEEISKLLEYCGVSCTFYISQIKKYFHSSWTNEINKKNGKILKMLLFFCFY